MSSPVLYPNVSAIPIQGGVSQTDGRSIGKKENVKDAQEFGRIFDRAIEESDGGKDLDQVKAPLKFSAHATQRLNDRKISIDPTTLAKIRDAVDRADAKGVEDTLVLTSQAAFIVNVKNRTVVTALDRGSVSGNVFTNIDGAVII